MDDLTEKKTKQLHAESSYTFINLLSKESGMLMTQLICPGFKSLMNPVVVQLVILKNFWIAFHKVLHFLYQIQDQILH